MDDIIVEIIVNVLRIWIRIRRYPATRALCRKLNVPDLLVISIGTESLGQDREAVRIYRKILSESRDDESIDN